MKYPHNQLQAPISDEEINTTLSSSEIDDMITEIKLILSYPHVITVPLLPSEYYLISGDNSQLHMGAEGGAGVYEKKRQIYFYLCDKDRIWLKERIALLLQLRVRVREREREGNLDKYISLYSRLIKEGKEIPTGWGNDTLPPSQCLQYFKEIGAFSYQIEALRKAIGGDR